jgi:hypothetical protein
MQENKYALKQASEVATMTLYAFGDKMMNLACTI